MPLMLALYGLKEILNNKKTVTLKTFAQLNASLRRGRRFAKLQQKRPPCVKGAVEHSETGGLSAVKLLNEQSLHRQNPLANLTVGPLPFRARGAGGSPPFAQGRLFIIPLSRLLPLSCRKE